LHLRDAAVVQRHAADQLHVEVAHGEGAPAGLAHERKTLREQLVERLAVTGALAQDVYALAELAVGVELELSLKRADQLYALLVGLELLRLADVEGSVKQCGHRPRIAPVGRARWTSPQSSRLGTRRARCRSSSDSCAVLLCRRS